VPSKPIHTNPERVNRNSVIPVLAASVALLGLTTGLTLQHQTGLNLREEQQALQQQLDRVTELLAENERRAPLLVPANPAQFGTSDPSAELLRLRAEIAALSQLTNELEHARNENSQAHDALDRYLAGEAAPKVATADYWPQESWTFAGFGSPDDALRSSLWASNNGNVKTLLDSMSGEFRQRVEKDFEGKPSDQAAIRAMDEVSNLKSVQVLSRDFQSDDTAVLTIKFDARDQPHTTKLVLKKIGSDWKLAGQTDN